MPPHTTPPPPHITPPGAGSARRLHTRRWIGRHLGRHRLLLSCFVVAALAANLLSSLVPVQVGRAFAAATSPDDGIGALPGIAAVIAALLVGRFVTDLSATAAIEVVAQRVKRDARDELYRGLLGKRQSFHDRQRVGDILARAINDARLVDYMVNPGMATAFNAVVAVLLPVVLIGFVSAQLLLAPLVVVVVFGIALWHHLRRLHPLTERTRTSFADLNDGFAETLAGMPTVKALAREDYERAKFAAVTGTYRHWFVRRNRVQAVYLPGLSFALGMAIGAVHALHLYSGDLISLPQVVTYLGWLALFAQPISMAEQAIPVLQDGYVAAARMHELTDGDDDEREDTTGAVSVIEGDIRFEGVSFSYGGRPVLQDVNFHVPAGWTLAVVGPTGSGKTTLLKLVNRTYDASAGRVLVDGRDVRCWQPDALRRQIACVDQDPFLFSKSVRDNIRFGGRAGTGTEDVVRAAEQACADDFVRAMPEGYDTVLNEGGTTLSGGQRQRLVIARALLADPAVLTLDNATSAVDAHTERSIDAAVGTLMSERTTILVSHRPSQIRRADLVLLLDAGRVVDLGSHDELMDRCALYREIYSD